MGKENLESLEAGLIITWYFDEIGEFPGTVTPSSTALHTTLFIWTYEEGYKASLEVHFRYYGGK